MNAPEDPQLSPLDQRAAAASTDLAGRAAARPVPEFDAHRAVVHDLAVGRPHPARRALAVAAVVLVIAAVAGMLVAKSGTDDDKARVISGDPRPFVAGDLPPGFALAGVGEVTSETGGADEGEGFTGPITLFGPRAQDPQLGIAVIRRWSAKVADSSKIPQVELPDGRTAYRYDGLGMGTRALVTPIDDGRALIVVTPTMGARWVEALSAEITVDDEDRFDRHGFTFPEDWEELGQVPDLLGLVNPMVSTMTDAVEGNYVVYTEGGGERVPATDSTDSGSSSGSGASSGSSSGSSEGGGGGSSDEQGAPDQLLPASDGVIQLSSTSGDQAQVYAGAVVADASETTTVRGHEALLATVELGHGAEPMRSVSWIERPGELLRLSGSGIDQDQLLTVAEGLRPIGAAEWKDLLERTQLGEFDPANADDPAATKVGEGTFPDGGRWLLGARASGTPDEPGVSPELSVSGIDDRASQSSSSSGMASGSGTEIGGSDETPILGTEVVSTGGRTFVGVLLAPNVARIQLRTADDQVVGEPDIVEGGGHRGTAAEIPKGVTHLVALAADGTELGRTAVTIDGGRSEQGEATETTAVAGPGG